MLSFVSIGNRPISQCLKKKAFPFEEGIFFLIIVAVFVVHPHHPRLYVVHYLLANFIQHSDSCHIRAGGEGYGVRKSYGDGEVSISKSMRRSSESRKWGHLASERMQLSTVPMRMSLGAIISNCMSGVWALPLQLLVF